MNASAADDIRAASRVARNERSRGGRPHWAARTVKSTVSEQV